MTRGEVSARKRVGHWMLLARERNGLTKKQVALACGVARNTVHTWETGERMPGVLLFVAWCRAALVEPERAIAAVELLSEEAQ